ncbi:hypothetical protein PT974_08419 [Cladobotryum mycophilum]|uniref:Uncharacterized protein n=1 Tax=Cladobotryum mycophilum TaxID=491253 RepID=A0ABR0SDA4_9HYPO
MRAKSRTIDEVAMGWSKGLAERKEILARLPDTLRSVETRKLPFSNKQEMYGFPRASRKQRLELCTPGIYFICTGYDLEGNMIQPPHHDRHNAGVPGKVRWEAFLTRYHDVEQARWKASSSGTDYAVIKKTRKSKLGVDDLKTLVDLRIEMVQQQLVTEVREASNEVEGVTAMPPTFLPRPGH